MIIQEKQFEIWQSVMNLKARIKPGSTLVGFTKLWSIWVEVLHRYGQND